MRATAPTPSATAWWKRTTTPGPFADAPGTIRTSHKGRSSGNGVVISDAHRRASPASPPTASTTRTCRVRSSSQCSQTRPRRSARTLSASRLKPTPAPSPSRSAIPIRSRLISAAPSWETKPPGPRSPAIRNTLTWSLASIRTFDASAALNRSPPSVLTTTSTPPTTSFPQTSEGCQRPEAQIDGPAVRSPIPSTLGVTHY